MNAEEIVRAFVPYDDCFEWRGPQEAGEAVEGKE
jgi:hypothetical protein